MVKNTDASIQRLLHGASFEVHHSELAPGTINEQREQIRTICAIMPQGTDVYIPQAPGDHILEMVGISQLFKNEGLNPIPHICARRLSLANLEMGLEGFQEIGVDTALILGGDVCDRDVKDFKSSGDVLLSPLLGEYGFKTLLFGGHPEGNRLRPDQSTSDWGILFDKMEYASDNGFKTGVVTQASYNPTAVIQWVHEYEQRVQESAVLSRSFNPPSLDIGIIGPATLREKFAFAALCQIDSPSDMIKKVGLGKAASFAVNSKPDHMIAELAGSINVDRASLRFSTIGKIQTTLQNYVKPLSEGNFETRKSMLGNTYFDLGSI